MIDNHKNSHIWISINYYSHIIEHIAYKYSILER